MEAIAITKYLRISPRKLRLVADTVRYKPVASAFAILENLNKKGSEMVSKTLKSAAANAKVKKMDEARLYVQEIKADGGPSLKRYMPRSMGRADVILKRMSHLTVIVGERELPVGPKKVEIKETKEPKTKKIKLPASKEKKTKAAAAAKS